MKHFRLIYFPLMSVSAIGVLVMVFYVPLEIEDTGTINLTAGNENFGHIVIDMHGGGIIAGDFASESGRQVLIMILDQDQYDDFLAGRPYSTHYSETTASDDFKVDYAGMEWCHVVVKHAVEPENAEQVSVSYTVDTSNWDMMAIAMALVFGPAFASGFLLLKQMKEKKAALGPISRYDDVVIFDEEPKK